MNEKDLIVNILKLEFPPTLEKKQIKNKKEHLMEIYEKAMKILPCITDADPANELFSTLGWHEICLILYFNEDLIGRITNETFAEIMYILTEYINYDIVCHIIEKALEFYTDKLSELERHEYGGGKHPLHIIDIKKDIKICLNTLKETLYRIKRQKKRLQGVFKGKFKIRTRNNNHKVQDIQFEDDLTFSSHYQPDVQFVENITRIWLEFMKKMYPGIACVTSFQYYYSPMIFFKNKSSNKVYERFQKLKEYIHKNNQIQIKDPKQRLVFTNEFMQFFNDCDKDILLTPFHLIHENSNVGETHANALIFNLKDKCIYRFEPHGSDISFGINIDEMIEQDLKLYSEFSSYTYEGINKLCPKRYGLQRLEKYSEKKFKHPKDVKESYFCMVWTLLFLEYIVLNVNNNVTPIGIYQYLIQKWDMTRLIYKYIHRLIKFSYEYINYEDQKIEHLGNIITDWFNQPIVSRKLPQLIQRFDQNLYNYIYEGHVTFDQIVGMILDQLNRGQNQDQIIQYIDFFLYRMLHGQVYQSMKMINETMVNHMKHTRMIEAHLPKSLWYYQDIVEDAFTNCIENNEQCVESLTNLFRKYFVYQKQLMYLPPKQLTN